MSDETTINTDADREQARKEAAIELGKGIALGLVPFLGQAIDAYDTIESAIALYRSSEGEAKETAQFDFLLALVGWIPGPGDGVKKSLRIVNRDPQRFAPVLFDMLRFVLQECGIQTSPEALLDEIFDAGKLRAQIDEIKRGVVDSSGFKTLPVMMQNVVEGTLSSAAQGMPALVGVVQKRLTKWKKLQRNSSSNGTPHGRAKKPPPEARDGTVAAKGQARPEHGHANEGTHGNLATKALQDITNEAVGISGEHIADYICLETLKWGSGWEAHDKGGLGRWTGEQPSATVPGKLSAGGSPKLHHVLYKLTDGANGTGIDAVWRASGKNEGKPFAIVEAKSTKDEDAPKFMRRRRNTRKPSITSTLGASGIGDPSELIEPNEDQGAQGPEKTGSGKGGAKKSGDKRERRNSTSPSSPSAGGVSETHGGKDAAAQSKKEVLVQLSHEWIRANIKKAVSSDVADAILAKGQRVYSRHLFFSPAYHTSGSPAAHMRARLTGLPDSEHAKHDAFHYKEEEVKKAVNKRKTALSKKYNNLPSLKTEL